MSSVEPDIRRVAADVFALPLEAITAESSPNTIVTWDSVQHLSLVFALEEELGVQFAPEDIEQMTSVGAIIEIAQRYVAAA